MKIKTAGAEKKNNHISGNMTCIRTVIHLKERMKHLCDVSGDKKDEIWKVLFTETSEWRYETQIKLDDAFGASYHAFPLLIHTHIPMEMSVFCHSN